MAPRVFIDHIVILLPHKDVINPPARLTNHFTISPGGRHADGKTDNKLILFQDGSYIELIAFVDDDPQNRAGHRWGDKPLGIIDYALITRDDAASNYQSMADRLAASAPGIRYLPPASGGRKREDGTVLQWEVTTPETVQNGQLPFFCHDVTPRALRVPASPASTAHPSGALGVEALAVLVPGGQTEALGKGYAAVLDTSAEGDETELVFVVASLHVPPGKESLRIRVASPKGEEEQRIVDEEGLLLTHLKFGGMNIPVKWIV
ncbi:hypothetical protein BP6252_04840 [Coleophoma cylindrospora]|uniref:Glyoxalase-like domain-containing protein n=1 Tax=Coleophoma cylindrospora TaxID=1849047 RepID=A0A3D8S1L1_9HELO|nr:hypothetical protein BP6252_04840 [Coleophoma cylindrospora]